MCVVLQRREVVCLCSDGSQTEIVPCHHGKYCTMSRGVFMYTGSSQPPSEASSEPSCSAGAAVCFVCKRLIKGELNPQSVVDEACKASRQPLPSFPFLSSLCLSSFATPSPGEWRVCGWRSKVGFLAAAQVCSFPPPLLSHLMISSTRHLSS